MKKLRLIFAAGIAIAALTVCFQARASLGGDMTSIRDDQTKMQGTLRITNRDSYDIHEIQASNGVVVREYVSPSGKVFGVAWQGRSQPDLRQVLGSYYDLYVQAIQTERAQRHGHGPLLIEQPGLVLHMGGHMGSLVGRAYIPQNLPAAVRLEEIR